MASNLLYYVLCNAGKIARARERKEKGFPKTSSFSSAISTYAAQALPQVLRNQIQTMSRLGFSVTTPLTTLPRLRPCHLILMLDKSPKNSEIPNGLPNCHVGIWSLLMLSIILRCFGSILWQRKVSEKTLQ